MSVDPVRRIAIVEDALSGTGRAVCGRTAAGRRDTDKPEAAGV